MDRSTQERLDLSFAFGSSSKIQKLNQELWVPFSCRQQFIQVDFCPCSNLSSPTVNSGQWSWEQQTEDEMRNFSPSSLVLAVFSPASHRCAEAG